MHDGAGWLVRAPRLGLIPRQSGRKNGAERRPGAERAVAGDPLGLVTHFIPVTTWARLERRPMGRRGGQLLRGTPALPAPDPRTAVRGPSGGGRRSWSGSVSGRGSRARSPGSARLRASGSSNCAGSRAPLRDAGFSSFVTPRLPSSLSPPRLAFLDLFLPAKQSLWSRRCGSWSVISNT